MIPRFIWATPIRMDIFIFKELRNGSSLRLPCHMGSSPNGYVWRTLTKPSVVASLQEAFKDHQEKGEKKKIEVYTSETETIILRL